MDEQLPPEEPQREKEDQLKLSWLEQNLGLTSLDQDTAHMHELFKSMIKSGFTERQAIRLVALIITENDVLDDAIVFQLDPSAMVDDDDDDMDLELELDLDMDDEDE